MVLAPDEAPEAEAEAQWPVATRFHVPKSMDNGYDMEESTMAEIAIYQQTYIMGLFMGPFLPSFMFRRESCPIVKANKADKSQ